MILGALALGAIAIVVFFQIRQVRKVRRRRYQAVLPACSVLREATLVQDSIGYPDCHGTFRGDDVKVALLVDTMTIRRLPRLWMIVTLLRSTGLPCPVDLLRDPLPTDIVTPGLRFNYEHTKPHQWPEHMRIASAEPILLPYLSDVEELTRLLGRDKTKDIVLAPGGVRITVQLALGEKGLYRAVRRPSFQTGVEPELLRDLLEQAHRIADGVAALPSRGVNTVSS